MYVETFIHTRTCDAFDKVYMSLCWMSYIFTQSVDFHISFPRNGLNFKIGGAFYHSVCFLKKFFDMLILGQVFSSYLVDNKLRDTIDFKRGDAQSFGYPESNNQGFIFCFIFCGFKR